MVGRKRCRIWWPDRPLVVERTSSLLLFGWFITCESSEPVDVVVAAAIPPHSISPFLPQSDDLQVIQIRTLTACITLFFFSLLLVFGPLFGQHSLTSFS